MSPCRTGQGQLDTSWVPQDTVYQIANHILKNFICIFFFNVVTNMSSLCQMDIAKWIVTLVALLKVFLSLLEQIRQVLLSTKQRENVNCMFTHLHLGIPK